MDGTGPRAEPPRLRRAIVALEYRDFRLLFFASVVTAFSGTLQQTATAWQLWQLTGSPVHLGLQGLARAIPTLALSLAGGVIADRFDRRLIIRLPQAVNAAMALTLALLSATESIEPWHIYAVTLMGSSMMAISAPARRAIVANLVPRRHLMNAMALNMTEYQFARIIGPAVAGVLIALAGYPLTYGLNAVGQVFTFVVLGLIYLGPVPQRPQGNPLQNLVEGLSFIRVHSIILVLLATDAAAMLFGSFQVLLPVVADERGAGAPGFGVLSAADALGAVLGAVVVMWLGDMRYKGFLIVGSILAYCVALVGFALSPWFWVAAVTAGALGLTDAMQATPRNAVIQLVTPDQLRGRVSSFQHMLVMGTPSLGQGFMGGAASLIGPPLALILGAAACAAVNVGILARRSDLRARDLGAVSAPQPAPAWVSGSPGQRGVGGAVRVPGQEGR
jgi:MFS family permease